jgi:hypothetical protein
MWSACCHCKHENVCGQPAVTVRMTNVCGQPAVTVSMTNVCGQPAVPVSMTKYVLLLKGEGGSDKRQAIFNILHSKNINFLQKCP